MPQDFFRKYCFLISGFLNENPGVTPEALWDLLYTEYCLETGNTPDGKISENDYSLFRAEKNKDNFLRKVFYRLSCMGEGEASRHLSGLMGAFLACFPKFLRDGGAPAFSGIHFHPCLPLSQNTVDGFVNVYIQCLDYPREREYTNFVSRKSAAELLGMMAERGFLPSHKIEPVFEVLEKYIYPVRTWDHSIDQFVRYAAMKSLALILQLFSGHSKERIPAHRSSDFHN